MCFKCKYSIRNWERYWVEYRCKLCNNEISEIVDTYFNEREEMIECPLLINIKYNISKGD